MVDGVVVTTTTSKIIYEDDEQTIKEDHILRYLNTIFVFNVDIQVVL